MFTRIDKLDDDEVFDIESLAHAIGLEPLDDHAAPRGARAIAGVPRIPESVADAILRKFGSYDRLIAASAEDLADVDGVGQTRAQTVRAYLNQVNDAGITADLTL